MTVGAGALVLFDDPLPVAPDEGAEAPDVALPDPPVALPDPPVLPDPGLAGAGPDGELVPGPVGVAVVPGVGSLVETGGCGDVAAPGEDEGRTVAVDWGEAGHVAVGTASKASAGMSWLGMPAGEGAFPVTASCICGEPGRVWSAEGEVWPPEDGADRDGAGRGEAGRGETDRGEADGFAARHCEPGLGPAAVGAPAVAEVATDEVPGPAAAAEPGGPVLEAPFPPVPVPSTLAPCPPVSTLELTSTTASRSGSTARVAATASAMPASTVAGPGRLWPPAARSAETSPAGGPGTDSRAGRESQEKREGREDRESQDQ